MNKKRLLLISFFVAICTVITILSINVITTVAEETTVSDEGVYSIGFGSADITPPLGINMPSQGSPTTAQGTYLPLQSRVMTVADGEDTVVFVNSEILYWNSNHVSELRQLASEEYGLEPDQLVFNTSHTHNQPSMSLNDAHTIEMIEKTVDAIGEALDSAQPAELSFGRGSVDFTTNRRKLFTSGYAEWGINPYGTNDNEVTVLQAKNLNGENIGMIFSMSAHPTVIRIPEYGGDFVGYAMVHLEDELGGKAVFLQGTAGEINVTKPSESNPYHSSFGDKPEQAEEFGIKLADEVKDILNNEMTKISGKIWHKMDDVELPLLNEQVDFQGEEPFEGPERRVARLAKLMMESMDENGNYYKTKNSEVQVVRLGEEFIFVGMNGEVTSPIGSRIKAQLLPHLTMVSGYTNKNIGYVPSMSMLQERGYETNDGPYSPEAEDFLVGKVMELVEEGRVFFRQLKGADDMPDPDGEVLVSVEANDFSRDKSVSGMRTFETLGRRHLGGTRDGRWTAYENIDFTGATDIVLEQSTTVTGGSIELRLDGKDGQLIGTYDVNYTEGSHEFIDKVNVPITSVEGTHDLYLVYKATHSIAVAHIYGFDLMKSTEEDPVDPVDTEALSSAINEANSKISGADVGEEVGEYPQAAVDALEATIADAEAVLEDDEADQSEVDAAVTTLNEAVATFEAAVIIEEQDPSIPDPNAEVLVTVQAEDFSPEKSVENMTAFDYEGSAPEYAGDRHLGGTRDGRWTAYESIDFTGATDIIFTQSTNKTGGAVDLRLDSKDGQLIGSYEITESAGTHDVVEKVNVPISTVEGTHDLYLVFRASHSTAATHIFQFELVARGSGDPGEDTVDTTALTNAISQANGKLSGANVGEEVGEYPQAAVDALESAIADAEAVLADDEADQTVVDGAVTLLDQAVVTFEAAVVTEAPVDTSALSSAIGEANSKLSSANVGGEVGEYPQAAVDALESAIADAEAVLADDEADQEEVDASVTTLNEAVVTFEATVITEIPVDRAALSSAIANASTKASNAVPGDEPGEYPQVAVDALQAAIEDAEAVLENADADQSTVDAAIATLNQALETFEAAVIPETSELPLAGVEVDQDDVLLEVDEKVELTVKATFEDESSSDVTEAASYSSSDQGVVTVTSNGVLQAVRAGSAQITITYEGETASVAVKVYSTSIETGESVEVVPGKVFTVKDSAVSIKMPDDLPAGTTVTVKETTDVKHAGYEVAGDVYTVEFTYPNGTTVDGSFTLMLSYDADKYDADDVSIFYYNEETGEWEHQGGVAADGVITLEVPHFSTYGVFAEVDDDASEDEDEVDELPDTATSTGNWIFAGMIFLALGLAFTIVLNRNNLLARLGRSRD
ncbi:carbohydrate-binding protein [Radiobacillus sp. PE A8.2]|uniref:carbohydrate-binding protein n=1 Tax=Radiobacillus sp. PE A8.2 TaxID=3380349 RepID=UPI00389071B1